MPKIRRFRYRGFNQGVNFHVDARELDPNKYSPYLRNVRRKGAHVGIRKGYRNHGTMAAGTSTGIKDIGWHIGATSSSDKLFAINDTELFIYNTSTDVWDILAAATPLITVDADTNHGTWRQRTYFANGTDELGYYDGSTYTEPVTGLTANNKYIGFFGEKMWLAGGTSNVLLYSKTATPAVVDNIHDFSGGNAGSELIGQSGEILGLATINQAIVIGKTNSIFYINEFDFSATTAAPNVVPGVLREGIVGQKAMINAGSNDIYYFTGKQIKRFKPADGIQRLEGTPVSVPIDDYISEQLAADQSGAVMVEHDRVIYLWVKTLLASQNNLVLVYDLDVEPNGAWFIDNDKSASCATKYQSDLYWGSATESRVYKDLQGYADNDVQIAAEYRTPIIDHGVPTNRKVYREVWITGKINTIAKLHAVVYVDGSPVKDITIDSGDISAELVGGIGLGPIGMLGIGGAGQGNTQDSYFFKKKISFRSTGHNIQIRFTSNEIGGIWEVISYDIGLIPKDPISFPLGDIN